MSEHSELHVLLTLCLGEKPARLQPGLNCDRVLQAGLAHGVAPLLWLRLKDADGIPPAACRQLRAVYMQNVLRAQRLQNEQQYLLLRLAARRIAVQALKGTSLSALLYGDIAARQTADIDLLIPPQQLAACDAALGEMGYLRRARGDIGLYAGAQELLYIKREGDVTFAVDLHQRLLPYANEDGLATQIRAWGLTPALLLLFLCVNQITHRFSRLKYLVDVVQQLRLAAAPANGVDWKEFVRVARGLEVWPGVAYSLELARDAASLAESGARVEIPPEVLAALDPGATGRARFLRIRGATPLDWLARCRTFDGTPGARLAMHCTRPGLARARLALRLAIPPASYMRQECQIGPRSWLLPAYLGRLAGKMAGIRKPRNE